MAGLPALFSAAVLPFSPTTALPWVLLSWPVLALSGYRIWRIDHPGASARYEIGWRVQSLVTALGFGLAALAFELYWPFVLGALFVAGSIFVGTYALAHRNPLPAAAIADAPPTASRDDPPAGR